MKSTQGILAFIQQSESTPPTPEEEVSYERFMAALEQLFAQPAHPRGYQCTADAYARLTGLSLFDATLYLETNARVVYDNGDVRWYEFMPA